MNFSKIFSLSLICLATSCSIDFSFLKDKEKSTSSSSTSPNATQNLPPPSKPASPDEAGLPVLYPSSEDGQETIVLSVETPSFLDGNRSYADSKSVDLAFNPTEDKVYKLEILNDSDFGGCSRHYHLTTTTDYFERDPSVSNTYLGSQIGSGDVEREITDFRAGKRYILRLNIHAFQRCEKMKLNLRLKVLRAQAPTPTNPPSSPSNTIPNPPSNAFEMPNYAPAHVSYRVSPRSACEVAAMDFMIRRQFVGTSYPLSEIYVIVRESRDEGFGDSFKVTLDSYTRDYPDVRTEYSSTIRTRREGSRCVAIGF